MGEYHEVRSGKKIKQLCKLGVIDDWRYTRRSEAEVLRPRDAGTNTDIPEVLRDPSTLWRFPFLDEDAPPTHDAVVDAINRRDMFRTITFLLNEDTTLCDGVNHDGKYVWWGDQGIGNGGALSTQFWLPCPWSPKFEAVRKLAPTPGVQRPIAFITIYGERYDAQGRVRTIFRCGYCEAPFSMSPADLHEVQQANRDRCGEALLSRLAAREAAAA
ncbi:MAG: hypothetical protein Q8Q14_16540 [Gemmatimonadales bacterium]|nr:hypothetical protein [Gemmatimonadales bacterium]